MYDDDFMRMYVCIKIMCMCVCVCEIEMKMREIERKKKFGESPGAVGTVLTAHLDSFLCDNCCPKQQLSSNLIS